MNPCNNRFPLRPAAREEAGLFYSDDQADRTLGLDRPVGRVSFANGERMEFTAPQDYLLDHPGGAAHKGCDRLPLRDPDG